MIIGIPRESNVRETRVAATPKSVKQLIDLGYIVCVEKGAGEKSAFLDDDYIQVGASIVAKSTVWDADVITKINPPTDDEIAAAKPGSTLISLIAAPRSPELLDKLAKRSLTVLAMDSVPRVTRAQSLDVISSMSNIAGYRAVIEAAHEFGAFFTGQVTAAGKVPPAKVLILGAGVAGLAAIGTARALGAIVRATDIRAEAAEQVESMGAEFVHVDSGDQQSSTDGYAKEATASYAQAAARMYAEQAREVDIIITTALIPGKPAPRLLTKEMVASMKSGSVIVDMATSTGGNVEGSLPDRIVITDNGIKIIGYTDLAGRLPAQASQLFATNIVNLIKLVTPAQDGELIIDEQDVVLRGMLVARDGEVTWPPPVLSVSATLGADKASKTRTHETRGQTPCLTCPTSSLAQAKKPRDPRITYTVAAVCVAALLALFFVAPEGLVGHFLVFMLSVVVGFYVIGNVSHALHTPLMSVTNAISGIIVVGCLVGLTLVDQSLSFATSTNLIIIVLSVVGILLASINVFGGFTVTQRMLRMFRKG